MGRELFGSAAFAAVAIFVRVPEGRELGLTFSSPSAEIRAARSVTVSRSSGTTPPDRPPALPRAWAFALPRCRRRRVTRRRSHIGRYRSLWKSLRRRSRGGG